MLSFQLIGYLLKAALKDRLILGYGIILAVALSLSLFMGTSAITEQDKFTLVFLAGSLRFISIFILALFTVFFIRRAFETKDIEFLLTRPVSRFTLVLSYSAALMLLSVFFAFALCLTIMILAPDRSDPSLWLWLISVMSEMIIIVHAALFFSFVIASSVNALMAVFGLYVLGRLMGQILGIIQNAISFDNPGVEALEFVMQVISVITPRFDLMGQTSWLIYSDGVIGFGFITVHGFIFTFLFFAATYFDFRKRQF